MDPVLPGVWGKRHGVIERHRFIPDTIWIDGADGRWVPLRRSDDPGGWLARCRSDEAIVIQVDDGEPAGGGIRPSSSSTAPWITRAILDRLDLRPDLSVLEIGTGTGLTAALIAEIAGPGRVVTVEVDPRVAAHARAALGAAGLDVTVVTGDGTAGHPGRAPYDRVVVTAAAHTISPAWPAQTRPGGIVLVPWTTSFSPAGALLPLTVSADGTASGRFGEMVAFMPLRGQRPDPVWWGDDEWSGNYLETTTDFPPPREAFFADPAAGFAMGVRLPGFLPGRTVGETGGHTLRLSHSASGSWASCTPAGDVHVVRQHGPRRLWTELENAYRWWLLMGRPGHDRFGMTVTAGGQRVWLDSPEVVVTPPAG